MLLLYHVTKMLKLSKKRVLRKILQSPQKGEIKVSRSLRFTMQWPDQMGRGHDKIM